MRQTSPSSFRVAGNKQSLCKVLRLSAIPEGNGPEIVEYRSAFPFSSPYHLFKDLENIQYLKEAKVAEQNSAMVRSRQATVIWEREWSLKGDKHTFVDWSKVERHLQIVHKQHVSLGFVFDHCFV
jgi:hypothetical protein